MHLMKESIKPCKKNQMKIDPSASAFVFVVTIHLPALAFFSNGHSPWPWNV